MIERQVNSRAVRWGSEQLRGGVRPTNPSNLISGSRAKSAWAEERAKDERRERGQDRRGRASISGAGSGSIFIGCGEEA